jgi:LacI family transcriptional regulator
MTKPSQPATLEDVAALAEVSAKTVSRVVNAEPTVSEKTRERVLRAIALLDYKPNLNARMLAGERSYLIGLFYDKPGDYLTNFHAGAADRCRESGYHLMLESWDRDSPQFTRQVSTLLRQMRLDGVILLPPLSDDVLIGNTLRDASVPSVRIAPRNHMDDSPSIGIDDYLAARQLTAHLLSLGHRRIGFILGKPGHGATEERYRGFADEMRAQNTPIDASLVETGNFVFTDGVACAQRLLSVTSPPTAIFASNDDMAAAVVSVAHRRGFDVPRHLSVVGFDDTATATTVWPELTTIRQPISQMAEAALDLLIRRIRKRRDGEAQPAVDRLVAHELVVRQSAAAPPAT